MKQKIIIAIFFLSLFSCSKFLEEKPNTGLVVPESIADLQGLLDDGFLMNLGKSPSISEASTNDYFLIKEELEQLDIWEQNIYKFIPDDNYFFANDWSVNYLPVFNANYCLEQVDKIPTTPANKVKWENVKGSALFYRAYYFLHLAWAYSKAFDVSTAAADLGIALRLKSDFNQPSTRATVQQVYDRIIADTKAALTLLPDFPAHPYRPSKVAAYGLLARTYLSMRDYENALSNASAFLTMKSELIDYNGDTDLTADFYSFVPFNKETVFYTEQSTNLIGVNAYACTDTTLFNSYSDNDKRKELYFFSDGICQRYRGSYSGSSPLFSGIATNEMYLIRAECFARASNTDAAMDDLNALLVKRYDATFSPFATADPTAALDLILQERQKELIYRGVRFADVKRLNKEGKAITLSRSVDGQTYSLPPNDDRYALPIPREIIIQTGMQQN